MYSEPSNPCRETFVEPQLAPPIHSDEIPKPLMGQLVSDNIGDTILVSLIRLLLVEEKRSSSISNQTPVLHGTVRLEKHRSVLIHIKEYQVDL